MDGNIFNSKGVHVGVVRGEAVFGLKGQFAEFSMKQFPAGRKDCLRAPGRWKAKPKA